MPLESTRDEGYIFCSSGVSLILSSNSKLDLELIRFWLGKALSFAPNDVLD